jgi:predicted nucleotidyltransferase
MDLITKNIKQINKICDSNGIASLFAFGSVTTSEFKDESDIDLLVEIKVLVYGN